MSQDLLVVATAARARSYSPYSSFAVGAAVQGGSGTVYSGTNVENAAYPASMCAERVAVFAAVASGETSIVEVAVVAEGAMPFPCGCCLQVLSEFMDDDSTVRVSDGRRTDTLTFRELLSHPFRIPPPAEGR